MGHENQTREHLVNTAAVLFQRQGYAATGLKQILEESGVPRGSLYYYFPGGKEELAAASVRLIRDTIVARLQNSLGQYEDPCIAVEKLLDEMAFSMQEDDWTQLCTVSLLALETSSGSSMIRDACMDAIQSGAKAFTDKLIESGYDESLAPGFGKLLQMMINEALIDSIINRAPLSFALVKKYIVFILKQFAPQKAGVFDEEQ